MLFIQVFYLWYSKYYSTVLVIFKNICTHIMQPYETGNNNKRTKPIKRPLQIALLLQYNAPSVKKRTLWGKTFFKS